MFLGCEPIRILHRVSAFLVLLAPSVAFGEGQPIAQGSSWTTQTAATPTEDSAEAARPARADAHSDNAPSDAESDQDAEGDFAEATAMHWPDDATWQADGWNDFNPDGTPRAGRSADEAHSAASRNRVPNYALWLGAGLGWTLPFGSLWGTCSGVDAYGRCVVVDGVPTHDYVAQGPAAELDLGVRLARNYNLYGLWEHTWLGAGSATSAARGQPEHGDTDFLALGLRVSTDPDELGFLLDIAVGTRRMRAVWADGTELQMTDAPFETRLGLGADVRMGNRWSLMPMIALGVGSFGKAQWVLPNQTAQSARGPEDVALTHGWVGLQLSAHADIFGTR